MSKCRFCDKEFYDERRPNSTNCSSCRVSKRRWKSKIELINFLGGKCNRCGVIGHPAIFNFHHLDPSIKGYNINSNKLLLKDRWEEIKKCNLLCANCHQIIHTNLSLLNKFGLLKENEVITQ